MQREITTSVDLLDAGGKLLNPGWAKTTNWSYNRDTIPEALLNRLREWDYMLITNEHYGFSISMSNRGGKGFMTVMPTPCMLHARSSSWRLGSTLDRASS